MFSHIPKIWTSNYLATLPVYLLPVQNSKYVFFVLYVYTDMLFKKKISKYLKGYLEYVLGGKKKNFLRGSWPKNNNTKKIE